MSQILVKTPTHFFENQHCQGTFSEFSTFCPKIVTIYHKLRQTCSLFQPSKRPTLNPAVLEQIPLEINRFYFAHLDMNAFFSSLNSLLSALYNFTYILYACITVKVNLELCKCNLWNGGIGRSSLSELRLG